MEEREDDPGFPSGPWVGFWIYALMPQLGFRQQSLELTFVRGTMRGGGTDEVGPFTIQGSYALESRECWWRKSYRTHHVHYTGRQTGRTIQGEWVVCGAHRGTFSIWPGGDSALTNEFFLSEQRSAIQELALELVSTQ